MAQSGRKTIKIKAPVIITNDRVAVWIDEGEWASDFFSFLQKNKFKLTSFKYLQGKLKLSFQTAKDCTMFVLKYASRKK